MNSDVRVVWHSKLAIAATVVLLAVAVYLVVSLILLATGHLVLKLYGTQPSPQAAPAFITMILLLGVVLAVRALVWRVVVTDSDVEIDWVLKRRQSIALSSLTGLDEDKGEGGFDSLILKTSQGSIRVTPTPPKGSEVMKCLKQAVGDGRSSGRGDSERPQL